MEIKHFYKEQFEYIVVTVNQQLKSELETKIKRLQTKALLKDSEARIFEF